MGVLGGQPRRDICTNASRGLSATAEFLICFMLSFAFAHWSFKIAFSRMKLVPPTAALTFLLRCRRRRREVSDFMVILWTVWLMIAVSCLHVYSTIHAVLTCLLIDLPCRVVDDRLGCVGLNQVKTSLRWVLNVCVGF